MEQILLFTDGSANPQSKIGYGAYLLVTDISVPLESLQSQVQLKRFTDTSSTKLELQTLIWALNDIQPLDRKIVIYTDSQNIVELPKRRERLEKNDYRSKQNKRLANYQLYQSLFNLTDKLNCEFVKLRGHLASSKKNDLDTLFSFVDKASRRALRKEGGS